MGNIELSVKCRQVDIDGDLLAPENDEQQITYANARQAYNDLYDLQHYLPHFEQAAFVKWAGHNAAVLGRRYVSFRFIPDPIALPKTNIPHWGYNQFIIIEESSIGHELLWPDYGHKHDLHTILCILTTANAKIRHFRTRISGWQDTAVLDDAESDCLALIAAVKREQRRQRRDELAAQRKRHGQRA